MIPWGNLPQLKPRNDEGHLELKYEVLSLASALMRLSARHSMGAGTCETHALVRREPVEREARVTFHRSREELAAQHVELQEVV